MASSSFRRKVSLLLLLAVLSAPWTASAEPAARAGQRGAEAPWDLIVRLWGALTAVWGEEGCRIDPFGRCADQNTPPEPTENLDAGCRIDPFGGCSS